MASRFNEYEIDDVYSLLAAGRWEANWKRAEHGKPGKKWFKELEAALLAMPEKRLIAGALCVGGFIPSNDYGDVEVRYQYCAIGQLANYKGMDLSSMVIFEDEEDAYDQIAETAAIGVKLGMKKTFAEGVAWENDEGSWNCTPEQRYNRMLNWVQSHL